MEESQPREGKEEEKRRKGGVKPAHQPPKLIGQPDFTQKPAIIAVKADFSQFYP